MAWSFLSQQRVWYPGTLMDMQNWYVLQPGLWQVKK